MGYWNHREKLRTDNTPDPTEKAFFSNDTVGSISTALTREANQNVLDEVKEDVESRNLPAKIKIFLSGDKYAIESLTYNEFIDGLIPHLKAESNGIIKSELPDFNDKMPFLLYEDFNTKGLEGDTDESEFQDIKDHLKPHNFYFFWRAYGRSGKMAGKMGSWGIGKSVFPALSKINSFWTITIRDSDKEAFLIGQSVLRTHDLKEKPAKCGYFPYGYYGKFEDDGFAVPENSISEISKFSKAFKLKRKIEAEKSLRCADTGTSIIVPFPREEVTLNTLAYSTIQQFFYPILLAKLEVEIQEEDDILLLSKETLISAVEKIEFSKIPNLKENVKNTIISSCNFVKWIISLKSDDFIKLNFENPNTAYYWKKEELFKNIDINSLQKKFNNNIPIAFIIPIKFQPENSPASLRYFKAFIQKDDTLIEPENLFIREYLTITGVKSLKKKGVRGMVIIDDEDLVTFFGHAEGPAHTGWHKDNFKIKYENIEQCILFLQNSLDRLYNTLLPPTEGLNKDLLKNFFYVEVEEELETGNGKNTGERKIKPPPADIPSKPKKYLLTQSDDGFKITDNPKFEQIADDIIVKIAYMRPDSNPFKKYSEHDFDLKKLTIHSKNVTIVKQEKNVLHIRPAAQNFKVSVLGFDTRRDLIVDIK